MNIAEAARESGLPPKTIRYYEEIGLLKPARRSNGYRDYGRADLHALRFLQRARSLGFPVEACRTLLSLYRDRGRTSAEVKTLAREHLKEVRRKIVELEGLAATLERLCEACNGDARPECPIIEELAALPEPA